MRTYGFSTIENIIEQSIVNQKLTSLPIQNKDKEMAVCFAMTHCLFAFEKFKRDIHYANPCKLKILKSNLNLEQMMSNFGAIIPPAALRELFGSHFFSKIGKNESPCEYCESYIRVNDFNTPNHIKSVYSDVKEIEQFALPSAVSIGSQGLPKPNTIPAKIDPTVSSDVNKLTEATYGNLFIFASNLKKRSKTILIKIYKSYKFLAGGPIQAWYFGMLTCPIRI